MQAGAPLREGVPVRARADRLHQEQRVGPTPLDVDLAGALLLPLLLGSDREPELAEEGGGPAGRGHQHRHVARHDIETHPGLLAWLGCCARTRYRLRSIIGAAPRPRLHAVSSGITPTSRPAA